MKKLAILFFGAFAFATSAQAITWNFSEEGDRVEQGYDVFVTGVTNGNPMDTGITITATRELLDGTVVDASPYLDGDKPDGSGKLGGLGVCDIFNGTDSTTGECGGDDNQTLAEIETINMVFAQTTNILGMVLTGDHALIRDDTVLNISSNLGAVNDVSTYLIGKNDLIPGLDLLSVLALDFYANDMSYWITDEFGRATDAKIYLSALIGQVPVPAAVWLFGTAMLGLFGLRRKTKMEALAA